MIIKKIYRLLYLLIMVLSICNHGYSQTPDGTSFIANKGQWGDSFLYAAGLPGGNMLVTRMGFTYCYTSESDMAAIEEKWEQGLSVDSRQVDGHWYKVNFKGSNEHIQYAGSEERSWYYNYFHGNDSNRQRGHVPLYGTVKMGDVYDGIDAKVCTKDRGRGVQVTGNAQPEQSFFLPGYMSDGVYSLHVLTEKGEQILKLQVIH